MSGQDKKHQSETTVETVTQTSAETEAPDEEVLTPLEEKVVRMLRGLSEDGQHELKFALGADEETRLRLAMMEKHLVELFHAEHANSELVHDVIVYASEPTSDKD